MWNTTACLCDAERQTQGLMLDRQVFSPLSYVPTCVFTYVYVCVCVCDVLVYACIFMCMSTCERLTSGEDTLRSCSPPCMLGQVIHWNPEFADLARLANQLALRIPLLTPEYWDTGRLPHPPGIQEVLRSELTSSPLFRECFTN